jgi:hypothetical protein
MTLAGGLSVTVSSRRRPSRILFASAHALSQSHFNPSASRARISFSRQKHLRPCVAARRTKTSGATCHRVPPCASTSSTCQRSEIAEGRRALLARASGSKGTGFSSNARSWRDEGERAHHRPTGSTRGARRGLPTASGGRSDGRVCRRRARAGGLVTDSLDR